MTSHFESAVERAIKMMRENLGEQLTVDDMARAAMFSKFHFTRIFQRVTGVSPRRFLSALRLQQAKELLLSTSMNVADISVHVGYNSVGTFSSRFTRSVGLPPTEYRRHRGVTPQVVSGAEVEDPGAEAAVTGSTSAQPEYALDTVFLGLFKTRMPEGRPARCAVQHCSGPFRLDNVPTGVWYLLCQGIAADPAGQPEAGGRPSFLVGSCGPIAVPHRGLIDVHVVLEPVRTLDPPLLLALPDARTAVGRITGRPSSVPPMRVAA